MNKSVSGIRNNQRSVQDIDPNHENNAENTNSGDNKPPRRSRDTRAATYGMWFIGVVLLLLLFFSFSVYFSKTTVTVTPRTAPISVDASFTAQEAGSGTSSANLLTYDVISVSDTVSQTASSSGSEYREQQASGEITIYNEYSQESIRLVPETRFESPNGNIYRTQSAVTVPGQNQGTAGQVTVSVVAAEPGETYNLSGDVRLSVPGFAGQPQEGQVYARLNSPIEGGIDQNVPVVSTSTRQEIAASVQDSLRSQLEKELERAIPNNMIVYDGNQFYSSDTALESSGQKAAEVTVTGELATIGFDRRELSIFLANNSGIDATADTNLSVQNLKDFDFSVTNQGSFSPGSGNQLEFTLSGDSLVVWKYNKQALARDLQSLQRNQINEVLNNYSSIQSATINTRPFWKRSLPADPSDITITTKPEGNTESIDAEN